LTSNLAYGQAIDSTYKTFSDTVFEVGNKILAPKIHFTLSGGSRVIPEHYDSVEVIAKFLTRHPNIELEIGGHTDSRGKASFNLKLSEYRAGSVKNELVYRFGIKPERIIVKGYGESQPLLEDDLIQKAKTTNEKEKLYAENRRIELKIITK
jgi:outer membrane protein OmpA-like peptidoglycan-associated protein